MRRSLRKTGPPALIWLLSLATVVRSSAHHLPISYLTVVPDADYLHLELVLNPFELSFFSELDTNKDGQLTPAEVDSKQDLLTRRILECLKVRVAEKPVGAETAGITPDVMSHHLTLRAHYPVDARRARLTVESSLFSITSGSHLTEVTYLGEGPRQLAKLDMQSSKVTFVPLALAQPPVVSLSSTRAGPAPLGPFLLLLALPAMSVFALGVWFIRGRLGTISPSCPD